MRDLFITIDGRVDAGVVIADGEGPAAAGNVLASMLPIWRWSATSLPLLIGGRRAYYLLAGC